MVIKIVKLILSLAATVGAVYFLNQPVLLKEPSADDPAKFKEKLVPPPGPFLSPFSGFWQNAESLDDYEPVKVTIPEMKGKVKILFDERLVPHIFAENLEDAVFAQGYITARFRLWQMDMITRLAGGRLSEVLGKDLLENDKLQRRRGMLVGAENAVASWQQAPDTYRLIEAYTAGVNAWVQQLKPKDYPLEFKLLHYKPEAWSTLKTALVKKYMDQTLCFGEDDLESANAMQIFGRDMFNKLYPAYNPKEMPVIPAGTTWNFSPVKPEIKKTAQEAIGLYHHKVYEKERTILGSNNWAVSGKKTKSGKPILCNDPHLQLSLPSVWFEAQIESPEMNAYGVTIPGMPGILIGFNENIAWGETNVGHDVLDWYKVTWADAAKTTYQFDGSVKKARLVVNSYKVRGLEQPILDTVKWTEWGPVVYSTQKDAHHDLAMRWIAHDSPNPKDIATFLGLNLGKNYEDYQAAMQHFDFPAQNFAFASKSGDIAITVNGKFPLKDREQGRFVQDGSQPGSAWKGWIPREQIPKVKNPGRGFIASANQSSTDPSYPYYYNSTYFEKYRGRYLVQQLTKMDSITPEDMMKLQNSNVSLHAVESLPALLKLVDTTQLDKTQMGVLDKLKKWNHSYDKDIVEPVVFENWWNKFYEMTFDEVMVWKDSLPILMPEKWRLTQLAVDSPKDAIFDNKTTPDKETASNVATLSFKEALKTLSDNLVRPDFNWSTAKSTSIMHLARIPSFSRMNLEVGGNGDALNAISGNNGPSWRMVVALNDEVKGWGVFPGGQSGNPGSPFYDTGIDKWIKGEYNELFFMKDANDSSKPVLFTVEIN
jgi:penicillin amidase